ncbi:NDR1/HIN1-like protein 10 [Bidens hawaiensis]|uniref:NDR1/HIN1-like protein 10 n=1 Tax=Bidens hawaiensis TaxID=980011 RepID=UPI00404933A3
MADTTKPTATTTTTTATAAAVKPPPPTTKSNPYNRYPYRPNPNIYRRNRRRNYFCLCCFWTILIIILLLLIATIAGCILYLLYRPHRPTFSITSLKTSQFNLTTNSDGTTHLTSNLNLTLSTRNPNKRVTFFYDPITVSLLLQTQDTQIGNGSVANSFVSDPNNITVVRAGLNGANVLLESSVVNRVRSDLKKGGVRLKIYLDTKTQVKIESFRSKKVGIRIECDGIRSLVPKGGRNATVAASVNDAKCNVDLRVKIWKWTFSS